MCVYPPASLGGRSRSSPGCDTPTGARSAGEAPTGYRRITHLELRASRGSNSKHRLHLRLSFPVQPRWLSSSCEPIQYRQRSEPSATGQLVSQEIQTPAFVGRRSPETFTATHRYTTISADVYAAASDLPLGKGDTPVFCRLSSFHGIEALGFFGSRNSPEFERFPESAAAVPSSAPACPIAKSGNRNSRHTARAPLAHPIDIVQIAHHRAAHSQLENSDAEPLFCHVFAMRRRANSCKV